MTSERTEDGVAGKTDSAGMCRGLRILLVGSYPPPFGGIASHLATLVPGIVARRADDVAVVSFGEKFVREQREGFVLYRVNTKRHWLRFFTLRQAGVFLRSMWTLAPLGLGLRALLRDSLKAVVVDHIARQHQSNVVSFYHSDSHLESLPLARTWASRRATVLTVFGEVFDNAAFVQSHRSLYEEVLNAPVRVLASSKHCATSFQRVGVTRAIDAVYYGVDLDNSGAGERRVAFRQKHGIEDSDVCVLFMGRLIADMGLDVLLEAAPSLFTGNSHVRLLIAGAKGDLSGQARALSSAYPNRAIVLEDVPFSQQPSLYAAADMLVAPSFNQRACMGMAIKEAMAASLPVVAGAGGGVPEAVVDGETGYLVELDVSGAVDIRILCARILQLANDPTTRTRFASAGRQRAERLFSFETSNQRLAEIFVAAIPR